MSMPEGGLRDRYVFESFAEMVRTSLAALGWFDSGRQHTALSWRTTPVEDGVAVPVNTVAVSAEDLSGDDVEIGSNLSEDAVEVWVDIYAESDALGRHLSGDVRDICRGKMATISREDPVFVVFDMSMDEPRDELFYVDIENVSVNRSHAPATAGQRHWYAVSASLIETR